MKETDVCQDLCSGQPCSRELRFYRGARNRAKIIYNIDVDTLI